MTNPKKTAPGHVACYCRVSTVGQKLDGQREEIKRWLRGNRIKLKDVQWFEDKATGTNLNRPAFERMQKAVFLGEVDTIICWKLDRIARDQREGTNLLAEWCEKGVRVISVTQQLDLSGTLGRTVATLLFGIAEIGQEYRKERQAAGIAVAKKKNLYKGRKKGTTKKKPERAWEMRDQGMTWDEIAQALGVHTQTVWRYLKMRPKPPKTMKVELHLRVENNSKFVRGKTRSRAEIENQVLRRYQMEKLRPDGWDYRLTIPYESDEALDKIIYDDILALQRHLGQSL